MCGICGEITFDGSPASGGSVRRMTDALAPRGPDAFGMHLHDRVGLGHRRLKILDLSDRARQPMTDPLLGLSIVFNGCIYNFRELRGSLEAAGYSFFSTGDTEVVLKAFHAWGADCVKRLNGMFAFAIHEHATGRVVLARDRLGIKPLYLATGRNGKALRFASTLPALLAAGDVDKAIDPVGLHHYMTFHAVVPPPFTILRGIRKLPPATVAIFEPDGRRKDELYWSLDFSRGADEAAVTAAEWESRLSDALVQAVARRTIADVPVGVLLSGGLDSSLIVGLLHQAGQKGLNTFSIGFETVHGEEGDEFRYSDLIAERFGTGHHRIFVPADRLLDSVPKAIAAMAEPMVSHDCTAFYLLSEQVARHVKVVQSGQGADEVFAGYHWYPPLADSADPVGDYARVFFDRDHDEFAKAVDPALVADDFSRAFIADRFAAPGADSAVDKALRTDTTIMLVDDPVKRVDNMTMAWGLEARVPFLDHEVVELAARMPPELKLKSGGKGVLKDVARKFVPAEVIDRPKGYFPVPALKYLKGEYLSFVHDILESRRARERGLFQQRYIDTLMQDPEGHLTPLRGSKLWQAALLESWLQTHDI
ncbi:MAG: N-acetylglutaminylglutamine amidotransferase [Rhodospirillaceae bacterium]